MEDLSLQEVAWLVDMKRQPQEVIQAIAQKYQVDMNPYVRKENIKAIEDAIVSFYQGKDKISMPVQDVIKNHPDIDLVSPDRCYVPTTSGYDPQECEYIIHEFYLPLHQLKQRAQAGKGYKEQALNKINDKKQINLNEKHLDITKDEREGIERLQSNNSLVKVWECYCWYDINNDGAKEKCVITIAPDFDVVLRKITLPNWSGKFPFVKLFYELSDDRWFSHRGLPELIEDIVKEIDIQHMQKIDSQTIRNAPFFMHRAGMINPNVMQFVFGQSIPVHGMQSFDDILKPVNNSNPNAEYSYEREQMILESKVEELVGQVDYTLQSMINKRQPRTASEVGLQQQNMQQVFSLDADLFRFQFEELFNMIYELWNMYGNDEETFVYFGQDGQETIKLTKEEIQGKYKITVRGNDQNTNPNIRIQKAQMIMASLNNDAALGSGVINPIHIANSYKRFYQELDIPNWQELVSTPEQIAKMMQAKQQQPQPAPIQVQFGELTENEQAQVIARLGIRPDMEGRRAASQMKVNEHVAEAKEKMSKVVKNLDERRSKGRD